MQWMAWLAYTGVDGAAENGGFDGEAGSLRNLGWGLCLRIVAHGNKAARDVSTKRNTRRDVTEA